MTFVFWVIDSKFLNLTSNVHLSPFFFPKYVHFPLKTSPNLSCTTISFLPKMPKRFLPPKMAKTYFPHKMAMTKISASSPHGMDPLNISKSSSDSLKNY